MNVTMPSLSSVEMIRTNPAHAGTARLSSILPGSQNTNSVQNEKNMGTFESYLVNAVSAMNNQQLDVGRVQEKLITDPDSVDIDSYLFEGTGQLLRNGQFEFVLDFCNKLSINQL